MARQRAKRKSEKNNEKGSLEKNVLGEGGMKEKRVLGEKKMFESSRERENTAIDYRKYQFTKRELLLELLKGIALLSVTGYLFYGSIFATIFLSPYLYFYLNTQRERYKVRRQKKLRDEFREAMVSMVNALYVGYSVENSLQYMAEDLRRTHIDEKAMLETELEDMIKKIQIKIPVEQLFMDLAFRSGVEEIDLFASVLVITKRNGGNLIKTIQKTVEHLTKKLQVDNEIEVLIAGKRLEKNIMCIMPYFVILYMNLTNGNYMSGIYGNMIGVLLMSFCLMLVLLAYYWADCLIKIKI